MEQCYYHSSKKATNSCQDCRKWICNSCVILVEGMPYCQICWDRYVAPLRQRAEEEEANLNVPWQRWQEIGLINAFWQTSKQVALQPTVFFAKIQSKTDFTTPLFFALICVMFFWFPSNLINMQILPWIWNSPFFETIQNSSSAPAITAPINENRQTLDAFQLFLLPLNYLFLQIIVMAWMQQALVSLFKGKAGFPATFQIRCYAMISNVFSLFIPLFGMLIAEAATILLSMRGFQIVQRLNTIQAFFIAITPAMVTIVAIVLTFLI